MNRIFYYLSIVLYVLFVFTWTTQYYNWESILIDNFLNLFLVPFAIFAFLSVVYVYRYKKLKWWVLIFAVWPLQLIFPMLEWNGSPETQTEKKIKVISYNASFFRIPHWYYKGGDSNKSTASFEAIQRWSLNQDADVICFQEFYNDKEVDAFNNIKQFYEGGYPYYCLLSYPLHKNGLDGGLAIFSKYPIVSHQNTEIIQNRYNGILNAKIAVEGDTLNIVNVHLESFEMAKIGRYLGSPTSISEKYKTIESIREKQFDFVLDFAEDAKTIIVGDFNSVRFSARHRTLSNQFEDAYANMGKGFGFTHVGALGIPFQIDRMYYTEDVGLHSFAVDRSIKDSDHFPLVATFSF